MITKEDILERRPGNKMRLFVESLKKSEMPLKNFILLLGKEGCYYEVSWMTAQELDWTKYIFFICPEALDTISLWLAAGDGKLEIVKFMVSKGAFINSYDYNPLVAASGSGKLEVVKFLINNGAYIHIKNDSPFRTAATSGHLDIVKFYIDNGVDIHAWYDEAINYNLHEHVVEYLKDLAKKRKIENQKQTLFARIKQFFINS